MDIENDSTVQVKEGKILFSKERFSVMKTAENDLKTFDLQNDEKRNDIVSKHSKDLDVYTPVPTNETIEISVAKNKTFCINRSLIPLRAAQFLWFASGSFCGYFISLMLIQRGLTLKDFSFVFSMTFLFQILVAYISGIVADKLGNAKPVLLFQMLITIISLFGILLSPRINENSCVEYHINETCLHIFNFTSNVEYCKYVCSINNTDHFLVENKNESVTFTKETDVQSNAENLDNIFNPNETDISCNGNCSCSDMSANNCFPAQKNGLKFLYTALIWSFLSFWSTSYRFLDFAAINVAKKHNSDFGSERGFGVAGALVAVILMNFLLNIDKSKPKGFYENVFWYASVGLISGIISASFISEVISPPGIKLTKKTLKLFTDIEIVPQFFVAFVAGNAFTFNLFFDLLFLDDIKASKTVLGLHIMMGSIYGLPVYITSKYLLRKLDRMKIVILALLSHTIKATCLSFLYFPWLTLLIELTKMFSFHLFWISTVTHCNKIAPEGLAATVNAIVGTIHFGIGRSFSVSVGGYIMSTFGKRTAYRCLAGYCFVTAVLYATFEILRHVFSKKDSKGLSKDPEEIKRMKADYDDG